MELPEIFSFTRRRIDRLLFFNHQTNQQKNYKTLKLKQMFGLFKKKSEVEKLQDKYKKLMEDAYKLQSINRSDSDQKYLEADNLLKEIEALQAK